MAGSRHADGVSVTKTEKWWAMSCEKRGGLVPIRAVEASERVPPTERACDGSGSALPTDYVK